MFSKTDIEKYFIGEKQESWIFIAIGLAAIILAIIFFLVMKTSLYKGLAVPLLLIGIIMATVGFTVYERSDRQRVDNVYAYDMNPSLLKEQELPRMEKVMKSFVLLRWVEIFLLLTGIALYLYFIRDFTHDFWRGFGFALALMALIALCADYFAEQRGRIYTKGLQSFTSNIK